MSILFMREKIRLYRLQKDKEGYLLHLFEYLLFQEKRLLF